MSYLIGQILACLLIAFSIGLILGWFLNRQACKRHCDNLKNQLTIADSERNRLQGRVRELEDERSRLQLGHVSQRAGVSITPASTMGLTAAASREPQTNFAPDNSATVENLGTAAAPVAAQQPQRFSSAATGGTAGGLTRFEIEEIEGIGKGFGQRLRNIGIATTGALLEKCPTPADAARVAQRINLDPDSVQRWVCAADLMRVDHLDNDYAELLVWSGVSSIQQLAGEQAEQLTNRAIAINARENRAREVPDADTIASWIRGAAQLKPMLQG